MSERLICSVVSKTLSETKPCNGRIQLLNGIMTPQLRYDWSLNEIESIYTLPLPDLIFNAQAAHRAYHHPDEVQACTLLSIKTGGCPEDCGYCPQSAHYDTGLTRQPLMGVEETFAAAKQARDQVVTRFCMGAAWMIV